MSIERPPLPPPRVSEVLSHVWPDNLANGIGAFLFAIAGPGALILAVAATGGLSADEIASWLLAAYGVNGAFSIVISFLYRKPLPFGFSIPGVVLVGPALQAYSMGEIVGAYIATAALVFLLAVTGLLRRAMDALPMPIVMAMVAGVFLPFGIRLVTAFEEAFWTTLAMVAAFLAATAIGALHRVLPPILAALVAGVLVAAISGSFAAIDGIEIALAEPVIRAPVFSWPVLAELVIPLTITVVGIHNPQGFAILRQADFSAPERLVTMVSAFGTVITGLLGCVPTVITGPVNAILNISGPKEYRYVGGMWVGVLFLLFGLFAPVAVGLALAIPGSLIGALAGLAIISVLQSSFVAAFKGRFTAGATVTFIVTVAGVSIFNIGAAFWGLVLGLLVSHIIEPDDFKQEKGTT